MACSDFCGIEAINHHGHRIIRESVGLRDRGGAGAFLNSVGHEFSKPQSVKFLMKVQKQLVCTASNKTLIFDSSINFKIIRFALFRNCDMPLTELLSA